MAKLDFGTNILSDNHQDEGSLFQFNPVDVKRTYGVVLISEDEKQKKLQIHYEIDVICLEKIDDHNFTFELFKNQVFINEKAPDKTIDELAERCGKVLYPLQINVNRQGGATDIVNHTQIIKRWETDRKRLEQLYSGDEVELLLKNMDDILQNIDKLKILVFQRDWFINIFFAPIYIENQNTIKKPVLYLPFIPYTIPIPYEVKYKTKSNPHKEGDIIYTQKGSCIDTRSEQDVLRGNLISLYKNGEPPKGKVSIKYQVYKDSSIVDAITGTCTLDFPSGKYKKMTIEMYNLKNKTPKSSSEIISEETPEEDIPKPKKKKRFSFFGKNSKK